MLAGSGRCQARHSVRASALHRRWLVWQPGYQARAGTNAHQRQAAQHHDHYDPPLEYSASLAACIKVRIGVTKRFNMINSRNELSAAVSLPEFLSTHEVGTLSVEDRRLIVQQALLMLEQTYALLLFKVARYGINPLQRLRLMQVRLGRPGTL
jgi:hypothetical protein